MIQRKHELKDSGAKSEVKRLPFKDSLAEANLHWRFKQLLIALSENGDDDVREVMDVYRPRKRTWFHRRFCC